MHLTTLTFELLNEFGPSVTSLSGAAASAKLELSPAFELLAAASEQLTPGITAPWGDILTNVFVPSEIAS